MDDRSPVDHIAEIAEALSVPDFTRARVAFTTMQQDWPIASEKLARVFRLVE